MQSVFINIFITVSSDMTVLLAPLLSTHEPQGAILKLISEFGFLKIFNFLHNDSEELSLYVPLLLF